MLPSLPIHFSSFFISNRSSAWARKTNNWSTRAHWPRREKLSLNSDHLGKSKAYIPYLSFACNRLQHIESVKIQTDILRRFNEFVNYLYMDMVFRFSFASCKQPWCERVSVFLGTQCNLQGGRLNHCC